MATVFTSNVYDGRYLQLSINETINSKTNKSTLSWTLTSTGGSSNYYTIDETTIKINGTQVYHKGETVWDDRVFPAAKGSTSGTIDVTHNTDGSKTITVEFWTRVYISGSVNYGGSMTLTKIDRSAPTVSLNVSNITANGMTIKATASTTCNNWWYSLNNGSTWTHYSNSSGTTQSKTITGLTPNTTYNVKVRARKSTNDVDGYSSTSAIKTLGGSVITSVSEITADNPTVSFNLSVTIYNSSYTHTLLIKNGSSTILAFTNIHLTNGSNTITLTSEQRTTLLTAMTNVKSFTGSFVLNTYNGSTQIGNSNVKTAKIKTTPENSGPTFTGFTYRDSNNISTSVTENDQVMIQNISTLEVLANIAIAKNGATISSYSAVAGAAIGTSSSNTINVGTLSNSGVVELVVTVIDSRGYTSSLSTNIRVIEYNNIVIKEYAARRVNDVEDTIQVDITGDLTNIYILDEYLNDSNYDYILDSSNEKIKSNMINNDNKNYLKYAGYRYRKTNSNTWSEWYEVTNYAEYDDNNFEYANNELVDLDANYSYYVEFKFGDALTYDSITFTIPQGIPLISFRKKKVGVNKREPNTALDVEGIISMNGLNVFGFINYLNNTEDLNDIRDTGVYMQRLNANASSDRHYPTNYAGFLEVISTPGGAILQRYTAYHTQSMHVRTLYLENEGWMPWKSITLS